MLRVSASIVVSRVEEVPVRLLMLFVAAWAWRECGHHCNVPSPFLSTFLTLMGALRCPSERKNPEKNVRDFNLFLLIKDVTFSTLNLL
jgi:hypothetical protein